MTSQDKVPYYTKVLPRKFGNISGYVWEDGLVTDLKGKLLLPSVLTRSYHVASYPNAQSFYREIPEELELLPSETGIVFTRLREYPGLDFILGISEDTDNVKIQPSDAFGNSHRYFSFIGCSQKNENPEFRLRFRFNIDKMVFEFQYYSKQRYITLLPEDPKVGDGVFLSSSFTASVGLITSCAYTSCNIYVNFDMTARTALQGLLDSLDSPNAHVLEGLPEENIMLVIPMSYLRFILNTANGTCWTISLEDFYKVLEEHKHE